MRNRSHEEMEKNSLGIQHQRSSASSFLQTNETLHLIESYEGSTYGFLNLESVQEKIIEEKEG